MGYIVLFYNQGNGRFEPLKDDKNHTVDIESWNDVSPKLFEIKASNPELMLRTQYVTPRRKHK